MFAHVDEMRPRIGRPSFKPRDEDRRFVKQMSALGLTHEEIATVIGINRDTLAKHFREEIDNGRLESNAVVAAAMFRHATSRVTTGAAVRAGEIWLRMRAGWVEAKPPLTDDEKKGQTFVLQVTRD
jgi:DNA-binding XRE family transcriptional regulator